jgi:hypothetical protein
MVTTLRFSNIEHIMDFMDKHKPHSTLICFKEMVVIGELDDETKFLARHYYQAEIISKPVPACGFCDN